MMKKCLMLMSAASLLCGSFAQLSAEQAVNPELDCSKDLILAFFPESFVKITLEKFKVPKDKWDAIATDLAAKDKDVIRAVEEKADKMNPNPLKDPTKQAEAVKIFRDTLLEMFSGVLKKNGVTDDKQIQDMLDDVQAQKAKRFSECFPQHPSMPKVKPE